VHILQNFILEAIHTYGSNKHKATLVSSITKDSASIYSKRVKLIPNLLVLFSL